MGEQERDEHEWRMNCMFAGCEVLRAHGGEAAAELLLANIAELQRLRDGVMALADEMASDAEQHAVAELWEDPRWLLAERLRKLLGDVQSRSDVRPAGPDP